MFEKWIQLLIDISTLHFWDTFLKNYYRGDRMSFKVYQFFFAAPLKDNSEEQKIVLELLSKKLGNQVLQHKFYGGHYFIQAGAAADVNAAKSFLEEHTTHRSIQIIDMGTDPDRHIGLYKGLRQMFTPVAPVPPMPKPVAPPDPLAGFMGINDKLTHFREVASGIVENRLSNRMLGTNIPEGFSNILLVGPKGLGKTTLSKALAELYRSTGVVASDAEIVFVDSAQFIEKYIGHSETALRTMLESNQGNIIIFDELDALLKSSSFGAAVLTTLNTWMGNSKNQPIVIANCYGSNYNQLTSNGQGNDGLAGRFAHTVHLQPYSDATLIDIFHGKTGAAKFDSSGREVNEALATLVRNLHRAKGDSFANGREIDNIVEATFRFQRARLREDFKRAMELADAGKQISEGHRQRLTTVIAADIPDFEAESRMLIAKAPAPEAQSSRAMTGGANVLHLSRP